MFDPMLATTGHDPLASLEGTHVFDSKIDGYRMLAYWDGTTLTLRNRTGIDSTTSWPDLVIDAPAALHKPVVLDGEVTVIGGAFQDVATRDKTTRTQQAALLAARLPGAFVAFDILEHDGVDVRNQPYSWRRQLLELTLPQQTAHWNTTLVSPDSSLYQGMVEAGGEGVIAKRLSSRYVAGRSRNWLKYKVTNSLTCVGIGYEKGTGSRAAFGAMFLALVGDDGPVPVGKVGSGFTDKEVRTMLAIFENARSTGSGDDLPVVEVQCLGLTRNGTLRQPVYKGLRTDRTMHDATINQLEGLTRS